MSEKRQLQPDDSVIVTYENDQLAATVKALQASGKIDVTITERCKFHGRVITVGPGDVRLANEPEAAAEDAPYPFHGSESYEEMARRVEDERRWKNTEDHSSFDRRIANLEERVTKLESPAVPAAEQEGSET